MRILYSQHCSYHKNADNHPECPQRNDMLVQLFKNDYAGCAKDHNELSREYNMLKEIHNNDYVTDLINHAKNCQKSGQTYPIDADTALSMNSLESLRCALSITLKATQTIIDKKEDNIFCALRPPGHHAEHNKALGFCFFNWAFLSAYMLGKNRQNKVLIVDFDVHHGNGSDNLTRHHLSKKQNNIAYLSLHESPLFPDTGLKFPEKDFPKNILNIPYPAHLTSPQFWTLWNEHALKFIATFKPDYLVVSAGFDAHKDDPLSTAQLCEDDYERLGETIASYGVPVISFLEGGYNIEALENSVTAYLDAMRNM